eukprot:760327-Hanusia_phi.AAC.12
MLSRHYKVTSTCLHVSKCLLVSRIREFLGEDRSHLLIHLQRAYQTETGGWGRGIQHLISITRFQVDRCGVFPCLELFAEFNPPASHGQSPTSRMRTDRYLPYLGAAIEPKMGLPDWTTCQKPRGEQRGGETLQSVL